MAKIGLAGTNIAISTMEPLDPDLITSAYCALNGVRNNSKSTILCTILCPYCALRCDIGGNDLVNSHPTGDGESSD